MDASSFGKPTDEDKAWFRRLLPEHPDVVSRAMFGNLGGFVRGNMFMCLFGDAVAVRLAEPARAELLAEPGARPFEPVEGRPMKEYVLLPPAWRTPSADDQRTLGWVERALDHGLSLPPKAPGKPRATAKAAGKAKSSG